MHMSFDANKFRVSSHVSQNYNWIALDDHKSNQGVYVSMYFESVDEIDGMIQHLETLKAKMESEVKV